MQPRTRLPTGAAVATHERVPGLGLSRFLEPARFGPGTVEDPRRRSRTPRSGAQTGRLRRPAPPHGRRQGPLAGRARTGRRDGAGPPRQPPLLRTVAACCRLADDYQDAGLSADEKPSKVPRSSRPAACSPRARARTSRTWSRHCTLNGSTGPPSLLPKREGSRRTSACHGVARLGLCAGGSRCAYFTPALPGGSLVWALCLRTPNGMTFWGRLPGVRCRRAAWGDAL